MGSDIQRLSIAMLGAVAAVVPRARIEAVVAHSRTGAVLSDLTGTAAIDFPADLARLDDDGRRQVVEAVAAVMVRLRANL